MEIPRADRFRLQIAALNIDSGGWLENL